MAGVGMVPFVTPKLSAAYDVMAEGAIRAALTDAGLAYAALEEAYAGYVYGDSMCGQKSLYRVGLTGVPVLNVNNNCSTGSSVLWLARQAVESGAADCVLAVGFEQMQRGALTTHWDDRPNVFSRFEDVVYADVGDGGDVPMAARYFGAAGAEYAERYGTHPETFAAVSVKARKHASNNPYAVFRDPLTMDDVLASPQVCGVLTFLQCCPPTCGAAAAVICSEEFARRKGLRIEVAIKAQALT